MELGICSFEVTRPTVGEVFAAMSELGFTETQFSFVSVCGEEMPEEVPDWAVEETIRAKEKSGVAVVCVNGTYNMISPDPTERARGRRAFEQVAAAGERLGCRLISLCTGTRSDISMWTAHPDNNRPEAWRDLLLEMEWVLQLAEEHDLRLGVETEASNVVNNPAKALQLIQELQSDRVRVIMDCANLFQPGTARPELVQPTMRHAFELLGDHVDLAHGKDIKGGEGLQFAAPGTGLVDFGYFRELLSSVGYTRTMMLHGFAAESEIQQSVARLRPLLADRT